MNQTTTIRAPGETVLLWGNLWTVVAVGNEVLWLRDWAGRTEVIAHDLLCLEYRNAA